MQVVPGDLVFWSSVSSKHNTSFSSAVKSSGGSQGRLNVFHVSLIAFVKPKQNVDLNYNSNDITVIHAIPSVGVVKETFMEAIARLSRDEVVLEWYFKLVKVPSIFKVAAVEFAERKVGCKYNNIFSNNCRNSTGREAFYCCQLVRKSYEFGCGKEIFPTRLLNFRGVDGAITPYWVDYFSSLNCQIPEQEVGSHPADLFTCDLVEEVSINIVDVELTYSKL